MGTSEREHHIKALENLLSHYKARERCEGYYDSTLKDNVEALHYAISSIKTDLKYDLMYEGEEVYTKADKVAMLTELQLEIKELDSRAGYDGNGMPTFSTDYIRKNKVNELIQQKIDAIEGKINNE